MKTLWTLFRVFFTIGLLTFGGGLAMVPAIRRQAKEQGWMTEEEMLDCIAICQSLPGMIAPNICTYIGNRVKGVPGAIAATLGIVLPAFLSILIILMFLGHIEDNPYVKGAFVGVQSASVGLILMTVYQMSRNIMKNWLSWVLAAVSFVLVVVLGVNAILSIILCGFVGWLSWYACRKEGKK
ncbi:MAG: chromate transporter [Firmicutes bacterium]|nr:chromate transporter [Clostridiales bacterium]MBQ9931561.1 chromate transporter [Bacillota bacterium]